jgi:hypothetical protein
MSISTLDCVYAPVSFVVTKKHHGIVSTSFHGLNRKRMQLRDSAGNIVADLHNCEGTVSGDIVLRGMEDVDQWFSMEVFCADGGCGTLPGDPITLNLYGPVGVPPGTATETWVQTYLYYTGFVPELAPDTLCITIILQVGIDPTTN